MNKKVILVTGGSGFIGYHLVRELLKYDYQVKIFDNLYRSSQESVTELKALDGVTFIEGDVRNLDQLINACDGIDIISHQAAVCINKSVAAPLESTNINLIGSMNVFEAAKICNIKKVVYASSASVYGDPIKLPMNESDQLFPITPYCIAKAALEDLSKFYFNNYGIKSIGLRYFNVYGPRQPVDAFYTNVVILFIKRILSGLSPIIKGTGEQSMDFIHVKDIVSANISALNADIDCDVFNVGSNTSTTVKELAEILLKSMNRNDLEAEFSGDQAMVSRRQADISKIKEALSWSPIITAEEGLSEVARDIISNPEKYN